jgi:hypothetical protein
MGLQGLCGPALLSVALRDGWGQTLENARDYAAMLFLSNKWLLPLLPAWPLAVLALFRDMYPRAAWLILLLAAANFIFYSLTWAPWPAVTRS